jgi:hypothetical protein
MVVSGSLRIPVCMKVLISFTTSNRLALFRETLSSLLNCVQDVNLASKVLLIDDGSPKEEVKQMTELTRDAFPHCEIFISAVSPVRGHVHSMQKWFELLSGDFVFHCEDDWHFVRKGTPIGDSINILRKNPGLGQVAFSKRSSQVPTPIFFSDGSWTYKYENGPFIAGRLQTWPHFMLNPSVIKVDAIKKVGDFTQIDEFEYNYGLRWIASGYVTAFLNPRYAVHIGNRVSAYKINKTFR